MHYSVHLLVNDEEEAIPLTWPVGTPLPRPGETLIRASENDSDGAGCYYVYDVAWVLEDEGQPFVAVVLHADTELQEHRR